MDIPQTCGRGLAHHSHLPAKLAELMDALAGVLERHVRALDLTDPISRQELDAYRHLAKEHRELAVRLRSVATEMAGYRDLPMGRHDPKEMVSPEATNVFEAFVKAEEELATLLESRLRQNRSLLGEMRSAGATR